MQNGRNQQRGYTLIELIIVMAIISVLVSIAVPLYTKAITRTKETVLKQNLFNLRTVIDEYTFDKKAAPQNLEDLVTEGYLRAVLPQGPGSARVGNGRWRGGPFEHSAGQKRPGPTRCSFSTVHRIDARRNHQDESRFRTIGYRPA